MKEVKVGNCFREFDSFYKVKSITQVSHNYSGSTVYGTQCIMLNGCSVSYDTHESIYDNDYLIWITEEEFDKKMSEFLEYQKRMLEKNNIKFKEIEEL